MRPVTPLDFSRDGGVPVELGDRRIGIDDPSMARAVASLLTRMLADHRDPKVHNAYVLVHALPEYTEVVLGEASPNHVRQTTRPAANGYLSTPTAVHHKLGISFEELRHELERVEQTDGPAARFEVNLLCQYFEPGLWRLVAQLVHDGPAVANERLERHLEEFAGRSVVGNRNRAAGLMSASMIRGRANAFRQLMRRCSELRWGHPDGHVFEAWESLPHIDVPDGEPSPLKNTAPPWHRVRHSWWSLNERIWDRLGVDTWQDEAYVIRTRAARSPGWSEASGLHLLLRDRALLGLVAVLGARRGATSALRRRHVIHGHRRPDGRQGTAIELLPLKTRGGRMSRYKPIPDGLAATIESMMAFAEVRIGRALGGDEPLWYSAFSPRPRAMAADSISARFSGTASGASALIPFKLDEPAFGYSAHTLRAAAAQSVLSFEAQGWLEERRIDAHPISIAEALLDHENMKLDEFGYHGAKKVADRERLSAIGAEINWLRLTTPLGARKSPDVDAYRALLQVRKTLRAEREAWGTEKRSLRRKAAALARRRDFESVVYVNVQADLAADHEAEAINQLGEVEAEVKELEFNPRCLVLVPDDVPNEAIAPVDLEAIRHEVDRDAHDDGTAKRRRRRRRRPPRLVQPAPATPLPLKDAREGKPAADVGLAQV